MPNQIDFYKKVQSGILKQKKYYLAIQRSSGSSGGGGLVVSVQTLNSDDPRSNSQQMTVIDKVLKISRGRAVYLYREYFC